MASVNSIVRSSILTFPMLYGSRIEVLETILCVLGNGYMWTEDGEISKDERQVEHPLWTPELQRERNLTRYQETGLVNLDSDLLAPLRKIDEDLIEKSTKVVAEISNRMFRMEGLDFVYPQSKFSISLLESMPENVTLDWKVACAEMRIVAESHGWTFSDS